MSLAPKPFFCTGLPRSRTAWLSIVATTPRSVCAHEPSKDFANFDELKAAWTAPRAHPEFVGVSDSGLGLQIDRVLDEIQPRTLIVERDMEQVRHSLTAFMQGIAYNQALGDAFLHRLQQALDAVARHPLVLRLPYEKLASAEAVQHAFAWLCPGLDMAHVPALMRLNVQVDRAALLEEIAGQSEHWVLRSAA
jgi:hypothetical protein